MGWTHRIFFTFLITFLAFSRAGAAQNPFQIPTDTLGKEDSVTKWAFWNEGLSLERFPDSVPPAELVELPVDSSDLQDLEPKGIGWIAEYIHVPDSLVGKPHLLKIRQYGACVIYVDSLRIGSIGKVGQNAEEEERRYRRAFYDYQYRFMEQGRHLLLVRFSDQHWQEEKEDRRDSNYGIISLYKPRITPNTSWVFPLNIFVFIGGVSGFLLALGGLHLLIFLFYPKKQRINAYYVLFVWIMSILVCLILYKNYTESAQFHVYDGIYTSSLFYILSYSLLTLMYAFLRNERFGWIFWSLLIGGGGLILISESGVNIPYVTLIVLPLVYIESLRIIIVAIRARKEGSWILGGGTTLFLLAPFFLFVFSTDLDGVAGVAFFLGWLLLIPLSMSLYLAYKFANTSKGLEKKLVEVEELNQKNLEQEREKQRILEEKKEELEEKVEERTAELRERKEEVEVAHREITDSINYAQRIQDAVLPEEERYRSLPDHFILFRPRDPVSGDFHWGRQEGEHYYLAAVDCTGHGVPGGFMSMLGVSFLNEILASDEDLKPGQILSRLKGRVVNELAGGSGVQAKDGMDMAMLKFPVPKSKEHSSNDGEDGIVVEFAGAQNPLYLVRKGIGEDPPEMKVYRGEERVNEAVSKVFRDRSNGLEIKADKAGIGSEEHGVEHFRTVRFKAQEGDALYIFSDGYADQFGGPKGKKFRYGAFKRLLTSIHELSMGDQERELEKQFEEWKGDREQVDDVLVMGVRV